MLAPHACKHWTKTSKYVPLTFEWAYNTGIWVASDNKYNSMSNTVHIIFLGLELISLHFTHNNYVEKLVFIPRDNYKWKCSTSVSLYKGYLTIHL